MTTRPGLLFAASLLAVFSAGCAPPADYTPGARVPDTAAPVEGAAGAEVASASDLTLDQLLNATYQLPDGMEVTLDGGVYQDQSSGESMTTNITLVEDLVANGDLNDDGLADAAVILVDSPGGSGIFGYLAAVLNEGGQPVNVSTVELGDRTRVHSNMIEDLVILLEVTAHDDDDPLCCPTLDEAWQYMLDADTLVQLEEPTDDKEKVAGASETDAAAKDDAEATPTRPSRPARGDRTPTRDTSEERTTPTRETRLGRTTPTTAARPGRATPTTESGSVSDGENQPAEVTGTVWEWQTTLMSDGSDFTPEDPADYTVEFSDEGEVAIKADCNNAAGTYSEEDGKIEIVVGPMTMAACPEDSLSNVFVSQLSTAVGAFMRGDDLFLDLEFDSGTMRFAPAE